MLYYKKVDKGKTLCPLVRIVNYLINLIFQICDSEGNSLLHDFSSRGCERAVKFLIDCVSNRMDESISICNSSMNVYGETPLHAAAKGKLGNVAEILLSQGANPNIQVYK